MPVIGWDKKLEKYWCIGEAAATDRLQTFIDDSISGYQQGRDFPALDNTSRLSAHLHFGEISPRQIWHTSKQFCADADLD